jgi:hypothetical protein
VSKKYYNHSEHDPDWPPLRDSILDGCGRVCAECGGRATEVHHTFYAFGLKKSEYPRHALMPLCRTCHSRWTVALNFTRMVMHLMRLPNACAVVMLLSQILYQIRLHKDSSESRMDTLLNGLIGLKCKLEAENPDPKFIIEKREYLDSEFEMYQMAKGTLEPYYAVVEDEPMAEWEGEYLRGIGIESESRDPLPAVRADNVLTERIFFNMMVDMAISRAVASVEKDHGKVRVEKGAKKVKLFSGKDILLEFDPAEMAVESMERCGTGFDGEMGERIKEYRSKLS